MACGRQVFILTNYYLLLCSKIIFYILSIYSPLFAGWCMSCVVFRNLLVVTIKNPLSMTVDFAETFTTLLQSGELDTM